MRQSRYIRERCSHGRKGTERCNVAGFEEGGMGAQARKCGQPIAASNPGKRILPGASRREYNPADILISVKGDSCRTSDL